jgi:WD40 repeat protein
MSPGGRRVVSASGDGTLKVWDLETGSVVQTVEVRSNMVHSLAVTPDERRVVFASADNTLRVWELGTSGPTLRRQF